MSTLTKMALGLLGQLRPQAGTGEAPLILHLMKADISGGLPLMQAMLQRQSRRDFDTSALTQLGNDQQILLTQTVGRPSEVTTH